MEESWTITPSRTQRLKGFMFQAFSIPLALSVPKLLGPSIFMGFPPVLNGFLCRLWWGLQLLNADQPAHIRGGKLLADSLNCKNYWFGFGVWE